MRVLRSRDTLASLLAFCLSVGVIFAVAYAIGAFSKSHAATNQGGGIVWERELGRQKLTPTTAQQLTIPPGTKHAEIVVEGGDVLVTWNGSTPVDSAITGGWGSFKWKNGHHRKEENDGPKLSNLRLLCAGCTVWVDYFGDRRP